MFLRATTERIVKITLPSPSLLANLWSPERSREAYPTLDAFLADVTTILVREVRELARLGCRYIQLDAPHYPLLVDPVWRALLRGARLAGRRVDRARDRARQRGDRSRARGDVRLPPLPRQPGQPLARVGRLRAHRAGRVRRHPRAAPARSSTTTSAPEASPPLELVSDDAVVVLGLVTTKTPRSETVADLSARIHEAVARSCRWSASRSARSAGSRPRRSATRSRPTTSGASSR